MVLVRSTYASEADAAQAARRLLEQRVACCVHLTPIRSLYRWNEGVEDETEWSLEARTPVERCDALRDALLQGHPYEIPLVEVGESTVTNEYADWAHRCTSA